MACHGYLRLEGRNYLIEYIVKNSTYPITGIDDPKGDPAINAAAPSPDVRIMCRNILNAFSSTIEGMDEVERHFYEHSSGVSFISSRRFFGRC